MIVTDKLYNSGGCIAALGTFDGVHIGHSAVIKKAMEFGLPVVVVTSKQNPRQIITGNSGRILSDSQCDSQFERLGISGVVRLDFEDIRNMSAEEYLNMLCDKLGAVGFASGFNFHFGKGASGNADTLKEYAAKHKLKCSICDSVDVEGTAVSSTRIRDALSQGEMETVSKLLGRFYTIDFEVAHGDARGRQMGFPTINQPYTDNFALPKFAVYASFVEIGGKVFPAVTNVGVKPTFNGDKAVAETHICGYEGDIYGKKPLVHLVRFIRPEVKFATTEDLIKQIAQDKLAATEIIEKTDF